MPSKPYASLSLDLDNQWSYMKTHGDPGWETFPSYLDLLVPRVLEFLKARHLSLTVFVVGQDAALEKNGRALRAIADAGHEIGNHSFRHEPWLHRYTEAELDRELWQAEDAIESATGRHPRGFRGPGFSVSRATLEALARRGYQYDASTFPTFLGPLARAYYFKTAHLTAEERAQREALYGTFSEGFRPLNPYSWNLGNTSLCEIPVTTLPGLRVPIHVSYLLYLGLFSPRAAVGYFRAAVALCRATGTQISLLLHPLDFLGADDTDALSFFPAMSVSGATKLRLVGRIVDMFTDAYTVLTVQQHAAEVSRGASLRRVDPCFSQA
ncbi:MAG: polysaccharide deacetylase family protein [Nitrospiria bacterium]